MRSHGTRYHICATCGQSIYLLPADEAWRHKIDGEPMSDVCGSHAAMPALVGTGTGRATL